MKKQPTYIDLFAGAGGLSEGFIRAGFMPVAHVESDLAACYTLKTRAAYYYLKKRGRQAVYYQYLKGELTRDEFYKMVPRKILDSVINAKIGIQNEHIFSKIKSMLGKKRVDLIIGGPPCQAYSYIGRAVLKDRKEDERSKLYVQYGRFLNKYRPKFFVFENVPGLFTAGGGKYYRNLRKYYQRLGYKVEAKSMNAYEHGVVQNRERVIIIGWRDSLKLQVPIFRGLTRRFKRDDIFTDLPAIRPNENGRIHRYSAPTTVCLKRARIRGRIGFVSQHVTRPHNKRDLYIYRLAIQALKKGHRLKNSQIPKGNRTQKNVTDFLDRFKVVDDIPHTVIAHIAKDGHHFIHPDQRQLRSLSVREAARIQSFPDDFYFEGLKEDQYRTPAFRQIGNAVPPVLAERIAQVVRKMMKKS